MTESNKNLAVQLAPSRRGILPIVLVLAITVLTGIVHGRLSQRWGPVPDLKGAGEHLKQFPQQVGDWQMVKDEKIDDGVIRMLSCTGYVHREYVNSKSGESVLVAIMLGPSGPISVHTPEICYSSRAFTIQEPRKLVTLTDSDGGRHTFWSMLFSTNKPTADRLRVHYAWRGKENWTASKHPRFEFGGEPLLYKVQISSPVPAAAGGQADSAGGKKDPCEGFLEAMIRSGWNVGGNG
jgi:hypothetical protein